MYSKWQTLTILDIYIHTVTQHADNHVWLQADCQQRLWHQSLTHLFPPSFYYLSDLISGEAERHDGLSRRPHVPPSDNQWWAAERLTGGLWSKWRSGICWEVILRLWDEWLWLKDYHLTYYCSIAIHFQMKMDLTFIAICKYQFCFSFVWCLWCLSQYYHSTVKICSKCSKSMHVQTEIIHLKLLTVTQIWSIFRSDLIMSLKLTQSIQRSLDVLLQIFQLL